MLFDTHMHLNAEQFKDDWRETAERAFAAGVKYMTIVGFDRETIPLAFEIAEAYDNVYVAIGWHPVDAVDMTDEDLAWIESLLDHPKVVALGEMGHDYHWDKSPKDVQKSVFRKQI
ncbi:MAG TPA: TatD family hydrolase, partial [Candidatus Avamphibacillus intestinigallinarum]|nr:TatD family hydrolase [Candidatus Avamphibacillus intestinigallinarum]